jgi:long-chain acyl-CoA synthetase
LLPNYPQATKLQMLYERWRQVAHQNRARLALLDLPSNRSWTFRQLLEESERECAGENIVFPQGQQTQFVLTLLRAWRSGRVVCPLEPGQPPPSLSNLPNGCAHLKTTSATTGSPSLIAFTQEQLAADADNIVATMKLRPEWPNLGVISLAHSYGFSNLILPLCLHGIPLVLAPAPLPEFIRRCHRQFPAITIPAVPAVWAAWHEAGVLSSGIQLGISAGAPLPLPLEHEIFQRHGLKIHNFYGASECGGIAYDRTPEPRSENTCVGAPLENVQVTLGPKGCLEVRSPATGLTYWPEPRERLQTGCFKTTDLAEIIDGIVYLRGRAGDQIIVAGRKVSPEIIESAIRAHRGVRDCVVFGVPAQNPGRVEQIVACMVLENSAILPEVQSHVRAILPAWQVPREWWPLKEIPVSARGKISRAELRHQFLQEQRDQRRFGQSTINARKPPDES